MLKDSEKRVPTVPHTPGGLRQGGKGGCTERGRNITNAYNAEIMCVCVCVYLLR